jgi:glycine/D-amino acid oxidase-like deaminating enzyme
MTPLVEIIGQGLAGSLLAWSLERRGLDFHLVDVVAGGPSASAIGGGIINPVTGQRIVKSWRVDALLPVALGVYRDIEQALGVRLVTPMRVRRDFSQPKDREILVAKLQTGELAPYVREHDAQGFWIEDAARIDTGLLVSRLREYWLGKQKLTLLPSESDASVASPADRIRIRCLGAAELSHSEFSFAGLRLAKGEILTLHAPQLSPGVILNRGHWVLPLADARAKVGATFDRERIDKVPTENGRAELAATAQSLVPAPWEIVAHEAGLRVTTPDKHPVIGWSIPRVPQQVAPGAAPSLGIFNGLGSKGALLAPYLAVQWAQHLEAGSPFDPAINVARFAGG